MDSYPINLPEDAEIRIVEKVRWWLSRIRRRHAQPDQLPYPTANISFWRPEGGRYVNFGDELALVIPHLLLARRGATLMDETPQTARIVTVGSSLHRAEDGTIVWGTGLHGASPARDHRYKKLDVRAVRGPLTAKFLRSRDISVPEVYGDPGLLLPHICEGRFVRTGQKKVGLVPNLHEINFFIEELRKEEFEDISVIDPRRAWNSVVRDILDCNFIIASSLHGLVVADAYGIPNRYVRLTEKENILKYHDYYLGTGRVLDPAKSIREALVADPAPPLCFDPAPLMDSFPFDAWIS